MSARIRWARWLAGAGAAVLFLVAARALIGRVRPQDYSRRVPYRPPASWYRRISNRLGVLLTSTGLAPRDAVTLIVAGRRSGTPRRTPLLTTRHEGEDYLVALAGESEWVRNVRAAGGRAAIRRRQTTPVLLVEIPVGRRPEIISAYLRHGARRSGTKAAAGAARYYFGLDADPSLEQIGEVAAYYPVFHITHGDWGDWGDTDGNADDDSDGNADDDADDDADGDADGEDGRP